MIRPEIKVNDTVRFRTDGEIGEYNKTENCGFLGVMFTVSGMIAPNMIELLGLDDLYYPPILLEICNDFSDVSIGDEVEVWTYFIPQEIERTHIQKVYRINDGKMYLDGDKYPFNISDGFPTTTEHSSYLYRCIRIVEKQEEAV